MRVRLRRTGEAIAAIALLAALWRSRSSRRSTIGPFTCGENDTIEITGEYSPPESMFNTARLRSRQIAKWVKS